VAATLIAPGFIPQVTAEQLPLEEVIVTAQKRTESVQDIPSTVNVVSGSAIKDFNVFNFQDLQALTAGLEIDSLTGRSGQISMRGISYDPNSAA
jgi:iron complex outermembrane receptor protein